MSKLFTIIKKNKRKIGLSLRGGAFKGASHLGFLQALIERDIKVHCLIGSSIGAFAVLCYVKKKDMFQGLEHIKKFNYHELWTIKSLTSGYLADHDKIINWGIDFFEDDLLENVSRHIGIQVTNLSTYSSEILIRGNLREALTASVAFPMLIPPVKINGVEYIDGDISSGYGVKFLRAKGANLTVGLCPGSSIPSNPDSYLDRLLALYSIPHSEYLHEDLKDNPVDILIENLGCIELESMDREHCDKAFYNGYEIGKSIEF